MTTSTKNFEQTLTIDLTGTIAFIHTDEFVGIQDLGECSIRRASNVEPGHDGWYADLAPVGGPKLGPFRLRGDALKAEHDWLEQRMEAFAELMDG